MSTLKKFFNQKINGTGLYLIAFSFCLVISFIFTTTFTDYFHTRPLQLLSYLGIGLVLIKIYLLETDFVNKFFSLFYYFFHLCLGDIHNQIHNLI